MHNRFVTRILAPACTALILTAARPVAAQTPHLNFNGGPVLANPEIFNLYFDFTWDADNPAAISQTSLDAATVSLTTSNYFAKASQYGVSPATFKGSSQASILCPPPVVAGVTDFISISAWMECMTQPGPDPIIVPMLTGIAAPNDNRVYSVYIPSGVQINDVVAKSCGDFGAYHFFGTNLTWQFTIVGPVLLPQTFAYTVLPADCASNTLDGMTAMASHELIEAALDPVILKGWIDDSRNLLFTFDILKTGEAADICEPGGGSPTAPVRLTNGLLVSPYWSNADGMCEPITHTISLAEVGLPGTVAHLATFDASAVVLPFSTTVDDGTTHAFSFPTPVADPNPLTRYITFEPAHTVTVTADSFTTAVYSAQDFLTIQAAPAAAAAADATLSASAWRDRGTIVPITTDSLIVLSPDSRFRFDHWSGDASDPTSSSSSVFMNGGPKSATANYVSQHLLTLQTAGLGANAARLFNGGTLLGSADDSSPLSLYLDDGPLALSADAVVSGTGGIQYFFQSFAPAPPSMLTAAFTTTATYMTIAQLVNGALAGGGIYGPGAAGLANSYQQQFATVQADLAAGNFAAALADLQIFISHVQAQSGKHVTPALAATLQLDALLVYQQALCQAVGAGQIDAATANADYVYYSGLVLSLGGTVLPPC